MGSTRLWVGPVRSPGRLLRPDDLNLARCRRLIDRRGRAAKLTPRFRELCKRRRGALPSFHPVVVRMKSILFDGNDQLAQAAQDVVQVASLLLDMKPLDPGGPRRKRSRSFRASPNAAQRIKS